MAHSFRLLLLFLHGHHWRFWRQWIWESQKTDQQPKYATIRKVEKSYLPSETPPNPHFPRASIQGDDGALASLVTWVSLSQGSTWRKEAFYTVLFSPQYNFPNFTFSHGIFLMADLEGKAWGKPHIKSQIYFNNCVWKYLCTQIITDVCYIYTQTYNHVCVHIHTNNHIFCAEGCSPAWPFSGLNLIAVDWEWWTIFRFSCKEPGETCSNHFETLKNSWLGGMSRRPWPSQKQFNLWFNICDLVSDFVLESSSYQDFVL